MTVAIVAWAASSGLGVGERALAVPAVGEAATTAVRRDPTLDAAGLLRPFCARAEVPDGDGDRATRLLAPVLETCARHLDAALPGWRSRRVGLALGTSSGGMGTFETAGEEASLVGTYLGPVLEVARPCPVSPFALVLGACASGTLAIGLGRTWLLRDACDVVLAGGFDAVSTFVASGFEVLRATCTDAGPRPFRIERNGLALGEGAAVLALTKVGATARAFAFVTGFGASCDAVHLTAPDREGRGLAHAARAALDDAKVEAAAIALVGAHGTATEFNDAAEAKAMAQVLGSAVPVHAPKGAIGHTLGAAGALETLALASAMERGVAPASWGGGTPMAGVGVAEVSAPCDVPVSLKLSSAFGGANAALVVARPSGREEAPHTIARASAFVSRAVVVQTPPTDLAALAARTGYPEDKVARGDDLVKLALAACAALEDTALGRGALRGAGIVVGHGLATIETNAAYLARIRDAGAHRGEPRRFPYTTPNAAAGECAVAFGLTGPAFAVGGGPHGGIEAIAVARDLVCGGQAERVVVVAVDEAAEASRQKGKATSSGAVALLVSRSGPGRIDEAAVGLPAEADRAQAPAILSAHDAVAALADPAARGAVAISAPVPWGGFANLRVFWL